VEKDDDDDFGTFVSPPQKKILLCFEIAPLRKKMTINGPVEHFPLVCLSVCPYREEKNDEQNV
jgi:hypothetical protein